MNVEWIDISIGFHPEMNSGEGDPPFPKKGRKVPGRRSASSGLCMSSQAGTHVGAPLPFQKTGMGIDNMSFSPTVGLAKVIEIHDKQVIKVEELRQHRIFPHDRILLKTKKSTHEYTLPSGPEITIYMEPAAASWLVERRISTVGIDIFPLTEVMRSEKKPAERFLSQVFG